MDLDEVYNEPLTSSCPAFKYSFLPDDIVTFTDDEPTNVGTRLVYTDNTGEQ
jgi:ferredoxin-like protein FixX